MTRNHSQSADAAPALRLVDAAFAYESKVALRGITMTVEPGEAVALIGPNGSGKSTLLKGILGLIPRTGGEANGAGSAEIGYLPQGEELDPDFPIRLEQVVMMGRFRRLGWLRWPGRGDRTAVRKAIDSVGLTEHARTRFGQLSGGQRQRGLLARALVSEPRLVLLDEPFNGLDQINRNGLIRILRTLKESGVAIVLSTHDLELAREVCEKVLLLDGGQVAYGPIGSVLTLDNVQKAFANVGVEIDEHTVVVPGHEGH